VIPAGKGKRRALLAVAAAALAIGAVLIATLSGGGHTKAMTTRLVTPASSDPVAAAGTPAAFRHLSGQRSNRCALRSAELESYPPSQHLQGSCCDPMNQSTYEWQVKALRAYASIAQIPMDPYDVPVSLAQQLLHYDSSIRLAPQQQRTYDHAMHMSREHGPCCCRCWRWTAFRGMSKYLISRDGWSASRVALLIDDVEGCGGKGEPPHISSQASA
jgi:hypothetical protein